MEQTVWTLDLWSIQGLGLEGKERKVWWISAKKPSNVHVNNDEKKAQRASGFILRPPIVPASASAQVANITEELLKQFCSNGGAHYHKVLILTALQFRRE